MASVTAEYLQPEEWNVDPVCRPRPEIEVMTALLRRRQRIVEISDRVRRRHDLQLKVGEALHLGRRWLSCTADQPLECYDEVVERQIRIDRVDPKSAVRAVPSPVRRARIPQTAQRLCRHWSFHRVKVIGVPSAVQWGINPKQQLSNRNRLRIPEIDRDRIALDHVIRIPQVPGQVVHVAKDMTTRAGGLTVARKSRRIV